MKLWVGTSGYSYKEWKGRFYPDKLSPRQMLAYYAERFSSVEINNTFYRMPKEDLLRSWAQQVPEGFRFTLKASRRVTHLKRLKETGELLDYIFGSAAVLGDRLGPLLFQLPPNLSRELDRLARFIAELPKSRTVAMEFRHPSWLDAEVYERLRARNIALCCSDSEGSEFSALQSTANWGYLRLRRAAYSDDDLRRWVSTICDQGWQEAYVYFKHEDEAEGPRLARRFRELFGDAA